ncbi:MAG TPA: DUF72 domain-containing protein, partial [Arachidicoccus sp.]
MEFGSVKEDELDKIDFSLPEQCQANKNILGNTKSNAFKMHIGLTHWNNPEWKGLIYPYNAKDSTLLSHYTSSYNCIELNATWYKTPSVQSIYSWRTMVNNQKDFLFCPKMIKEVTHSNSLTANKNLSDNFIDTIRHFDNNLGAIFIQLNESFSPARKNELFSYLDSLPQNVQFFLEVRHPKWFADKNMNEQLFTFLCDNNVGAIITDTAARRDVAHMRLSVPKTFIRFVGNALHSSDYTRIDNWIKRMGGWIENGIEEIFFF